ncbi:MAG: hypothetical protein QF894_14395 [Alphaproteobacteria bacterium]|nr:hypothetical protein [Alphaproteobacteria bacterium]
MTDTRDWIDLLERREREADAREALATAGPELVDPEESEPDDLPRGRGVEEGRFEPGA